LKKIIELQKGKPICNLDKLHSQGQKVQDTLEEKFGQFECEIWDVELQWDNIKKGMVDTTSDLLVKVESGSKKAVDFTRSA
jgi:hypothetical protein